MNSNPTLARIKALEDRVRVQERRLWGLVGELDRWVATLPVWSELPATPASVEPEGVPVVPWSPPGGVNGPVWEQPVGWSLEAYLLHDPPEGPHQPGMRLEETLGEYRRRSGYAYPPNWEPDPEEVAR